LPILFKIMPVISIENISKKYQISHLGKNYLALRDILAESFRNPVKTYQQIKKQKKEIFWALKNINFNIEQGETVGIIGPNGAGKSTLLKILAGITPPSEGRIKIKGKVFSLLEVGTGFHPELTGRENIYLNGAIIGMTKKQINRRFDEIVEFSGVEKFLDTPVKHYSSGMYVRLAFSVAAHTESDILLVDEVLAVGDAEFQKKCLGKMEEATHKTGRTILFISHNLEMVKKLCGRCMLLEEGKIIASGSTGEMIDKYLTYLLKPQAENDISKSYRQPELGDEIRINKCEVINSDGNITPKLLFGEPFGVFLQACSKKIFDNLSVGFRIESSTGSIITGPISEDDNIYFACSEENPLRVKAFFKSLILAPGVYFLTLTIRRNKIGLDQVIRAVNFEVSDISHKNHKSHSGTWGYIQTNLEWENLSI
jgi:lipopolysaccharide transport system ATP-binding protein